MRNEGAVAEQGGECVLGDEGGRNDLQASHLDNAKSVDLAPDTLGLGDLVTYGLVTTGSKGARSGAPVDDLALAIEVGLSKD